MRIGFFTYGIYSQRMTGIARYTIELTRALKKLQPDLEIILLNPYPKDPHPWYHEFENYPLPDLKLLPMAATLGNWQLHRAAIDLRLDILHDPCGIAPFLVPTKRYRRITTIHDAIPFIYPQTQPLLTRLIFYTLIPATRYTADAVFTVSHSSARDLQKYAGIPAEKLHVTYPGVNPPPEPPEEEIQRTLQDHGIDKPYFLYVGALHPRKNLPRVLDSFQKLQKKHQNVQLVIVGPPSWGAHETLKSVMDATQTDSGIIFTGFVSDRTLHALYYGARALVFLSLYEGFGLPVPEAMSHGTPVITSNVSSLPEAAGDTAILVDPTDTEYILGAMQTLLNDDALHRKYSAGGLEHARTFSWLHTAKNVYSTYRQLSTV